jgi:peptide/nickel transport system substrate-binding protein
MRKFKYQNMNLSNEKGFVWFLFPLIILNLLRRIQRQTAAANPYLPVWLVAPRAWAQPGISQPRFDGSGRLLLQDLSRKQSRRGSVKP